MFSEEILEFNKIKEIISGYIYFDYTKKIFDRIKPDTNKENIILEYSLLDEFIRFYKINNDRLNFIKLNDISPTLFNNKFYLETDEIINLYDFLINFIELYDKIKDNSNVLNKIFLLFNDIRIPYPFIEKFKKTFDTDLSIKDNATPELQKIRKELRHCENKLKEKINRIINSKDYSNYIQDKNIIFRNGRYVISVKTQFRNYIPSIFHSFSNSKETSFIEPFEILEDNNQLNELIDLEKIEIDNIYKEFFSIFYSYKDDIINLVNIYARIEILNAKANFSIDYNCNIPEITDENKLILKNARHPLLGKNAIPNDIKILNNKSGMIISGPNAGGKTVLLKTAGLLSLLVLYKIPITADKYSEIPIFENILAEIGDSQSISNHLSTFSAHIKNISAFLNFREKTLILIDEICGSTDPVIGEILAFEYIKKLLDNNVLFIITTHYNRVKNMSYEIDKIISSSVEFDLKRLAPTYKLIYNQFGKSFAIEIAEKYGMPEDILNNTKNYLEKNKNEIESILENLNKKNLKIIQLRNSIKDKIKRLREFKKELIKEKEKITNTINEFNKNQIDFLNREITEIKNLLTEYKIKLKKENIEKKELYDISSNLPDIEKNIKKLDFDNKTKLKKISNPEINMNVYIKSLGKNGKIIEIGDNKIKIMIDKVCITTNKDDIYQAEDKVISNENKIKINYNYNMESKFEIDLRGKRADEAIKILEKNILNSYVENRKILMVIHGKGEGILRKMIWDYLKSSEYVDKYYYSKPEEGGQGKTIIELK